MDRINSTQGCPLAADSGLGRRVQTRLPAAAKVAWKFNINEVDLLTYNDLALEARFFYYINGPPDQFSSVARAIIPFGTVNKDGVSRQHFYPVH